MHNFSLPSSTFSPGSIHSDAVRAFWQDTLEAQSWVMDVISNGYAIPFTSLPPRYEEPNNTSALKNMEIVTSLVHEMIALGVVSVVKEKPFCVSPLGLVTKESENGPKHRLIFDASRCINLCVHPPTVKLTFLQKALESTSPNDLQFVFNLKSAYYHVAIHKDHRQFLGACIPTSEGPLYFVYNVLPFGLNSAVHAITKLFKPIIAYLHRLNVKLSIYIDDGRVVSPTFEKATRDLKITYDTLHAAGWTLESNKSDSVKDINCVKNYLGFTIDTIQMRVSKDPDALGALCDWILPQLSLETLPVKQLSKILGKIVALIPSHGPLALVCTRSGYCVVEDHVEKNGWSGSVTLTENCDFGEAPE
jgi:hypothetical protein